jgi:hypothetical protein
MKKIVVAFCCLLGLNSCIFTSNDPEDFEPVVNYNPVIMERTAFEASVEVLPPTNIIKAGKIYIKDNFTFINDVNRGYHVYNYSDATSPIAIAFIKMPGATDLAIRDNVLYINQAVDLVTLLYNTSTNELEIKDRDRNVFPQKISPDGSIASTNQNQIVVNWTQN